ncbi:hypothetical protein GF382_02230 [Candidatus Falkowbacteria bacterium]|nr:hypothetical protein [Candidatus Falkowbacteria bacterium]
MLNIKIDKFEGPLGLLLTMIEGEKLDIAEVNLAKVADQYVEYIKNSKDINPELLADFLVIAAKLLYIKSKALLPYLFPEEDEELGDLEKQLKMYREFLNASEDLEKRLKEEKFMFSPTNNLLERARDFSDLFAFSPPQKTRKENLAEAFGSFLERRRPKERALREETIEYKINIEDKILNIEKLLVEKITYNFSKILEKVESKTEVIVSFLALLELVKQKSVGAAQDGLFADININKK